MMEEFKEKKIGDFTVEYLGVGYSDYFNGYGIGPCSDFEYSAYGIGDTEEEAFCDCLEMVVQQGFIVDDEEEKEIRKFYGDTDDNKTALEEVDPAGEYDDEDLIDYPYHYVGMEWNAAK